MEGEGELTQSEICLQDKNNLHDNTVSGEVNYKVSIYPIILKTIIT